MSSTKSYTIGFKHSLPYSSPNYFLLFNFFFLFLHRHLFVFSIFLSPFLPFAHSYFVCWRRRGTAQIIDLKWLWSSVMSIMSGAVCVHYTDFNSSWTFMTRSWQRKGRYRRYCRFSFALEMELPPLHNPAQVSTTTCWDLARNVVSIIFTELLSVSWCTITTLILKRLNSLSVFTCMSQLSSSLSVCLHIIFTPSVCLETH